MAGRKSSMGRPPPPSRKSSKAHYRPQVSAASRRPSLPSSRRSSRPATHQTHSTLRPLTPLDEDEYESFYSDDASSVIVPRNLYKPPQDQHIRSNLRLVNEYLHSTEIEDIFNSTLKSLMSLPDLPYNPYPGFVRRLKIQAERFHLYEKSAEEISEILRNKHEQTSIHFIVRPVKCDFIWGLKSIVRLIEPDNIYPYKWLLHNVSPQLEKLARSPDYSNQVMVALVGPSVFHGPLYVYPHTIDIRLQYLITGPEVSKAVSLYISSIVNDITATQNGGIHTLIGVNVPVANELEADTWNAELWSFEAIQENRDEFWQIVSEAVAENQLITAECVFRLDEKGLKWRRGQKQYSMFFLQVSKRRGANEELSFFTEFPLVTLHEGIFLKQSHAEAYLTTFTPRLDLAEADRENINSGSHRASRSTLQSGMSLKRPDEEKVPLKVRIDGFSLGLRTGFGPQAWQVTTPIKSHWQRKIAGLETQADLFDVVYYALLLVLMDRESYEDKILIELYRVLHSTAARLYYLVQLNKTIRELVVKFEGNSHSQLVMTMFMEYKRGFLALSDTVLQEWSSDLMTTCRSVIQKLDSLVVPLDHDNDTIPLTRQTLEALKNINSYCYSLLLNLTDDTLVSCPTLQNLIQKLQETFPEDIPRPKTAIRKRKEKRRVGRRMGEGINVFKHGMELESILKHDDQVINIEMCMERDSAPKSIGVENVLMRYLVDTHLDEVWPQFLIDLLSSTTFPPNPFPKLVTTLRQCAMRMDLMYEQPAKLRDQLVHGSSRLEDAEHFIHHIPGCDAHGVETALATLDTGSYFQLVPLLQPMVQSNFLMKRGPYRVAICSAVVGPTVMYGRMEPYIQQIDMHEHCYVRGPDGCAAEAMQLYSKITHEHLKELHSGGRYFLAGLYMGKSQTRWSIPELMERKKAFALEFEQHIAQKEPITIKMFVELDWRLIPVTKVLHLHYLNDEETLHEIFFQEDHASLYQAVFFDKERAAFHLQYGQMHGASDPFSHVAIKPAVRQLETEILLKAKSQDWLAVYRRLLLRNLINQGNVLIVEVWRMLHSIAGQAEYARFLGASLQDLTHLYDDLQNHGSRSGSRQNLSTIRDSTARSGIRRDSRVTSRLSSAARSQKTHSTHDDEEEEEEGEGEDEDSTVNTPLMQRLEQQMGQLAMAYRLKVERVARAQCSFTTRGLYKALQTKLVKIMERDELTRQLFLIPDAKTIYIIEEINNMLLQLQETASYDVHCTCEEAQAVLKSIEAERGSTTLQDRPCSVASVTLSNPDKFDRNRPQADTADHVDVWMQPRALSID